MKTKESFHKLIDNIEDEQLLERQAADKKNNYNLVCSLLLQHGEGIRITLTVGTRPATILGHFFVIRK